MCQNVKRRMFRGLTCVFLVATIYYYFWMICSWIGLDAKKRERADERMVAKATKSDRTTTIPSEDWRKDSGEDLPDYAFFLRQPTEYCDSVLKVNTSSGAAHIVKLVSIDGQRDILSYYIPAGETREINVPSGTYELRYCSGTRWFGCIRMFGRTASYAKADQLFTFDDGSGYEITLYRVAYGNLHTSAIDPEDF